MILEVNDLHAYYGQSHVLRGVHLSVGEGEMPLAETENVKGKPNKQLVEDYAFWFWNNR